MTTVAGTAVVLPAEGLDTLVELLRARGYTVIGPTVRDGAIVHAELASASDLPSGVSDEQAPGRYRLQHGAGDGARFSYAAASGGWKPFLFPSRSRVSAFHRGVNGEPVLDDQPEVVPQYAFVGVRACDLAAIGVQDRVLSAGPYVDGRYAQARRRSLIIAVNCATPSGVCFCVSMGTGPRATSGHDLALTEIVDGGGHRFLVEVGSAAGAELLDHLPVRGRTDDDVAAADAVVDGARAHMGRELDTAGLPALLKRNLESPRWQEVAERCLSCGNCTLVCPTCFCSDTVERNHPDGDGGERLREWASCFSLDHSYLHGGAVRTSVASRYRQWAVHKLSTWWDQFGTSGCVGCGRCIAWCPVGIDITAEVAAIRATDGAVTTAAVEQA